MSYPTCLRPTYDSTSMTLFRNRYRIETARHPGADYAARGWYFVTICTRHRRCSLGNIVNGEIALSTAGTIAAAEMRQVPKHYLNVYVDQFVVMPNHVHAIIVIDGLHSHSPEPAAQTPPHPVTNKPHSNSLGHIVGGYKAGVTRACRLAGIVDLGWQERFYDHILRSNASVNAVREYIERNPQNWLDDPDRMTM